MKKKHPKHEKRSWRITSFGFVLSIITGYISYTATTSGIESNPWLVVTAGVLSIIFLGLAIIGKKSTLYSIGGWIADAVNIT